VGHSGPPRQDGVSVVALIDQNAGCVQERLPGRSHQQLAGARMPRLEIPRGDFDRRNDGDEGRPLSSRVTVQPWGGHSRGPTAERGDSFAGAPIQPLPDGCTAEDDPSAQSYRGRCIAGFEKAAGRGAQKHEAIEQAQEACSFRCQNLLVHPTSATPGCEAVHCRNGNCIFKCPVRVTAYPKAARTTVVENPTTSRGSPIAPPPPPGDRRAPLSAPGRSLGGRRLHFSSKGLERLKTNGWRRGVFSLASPGGPL
jgi:hypothetical protein